MTKNLLRLLALSTGIALLGCGTKAPEEKTATVTGKVTLTGKPLPGGTITFRSTAAAHRVGFGEIKPDGTYEAKNVPQGECKVSVTNIHLKPVDKATGTPSTDGYQGPPPGAKYVPIPDKYTSEATTPLTASITSDPATYNAELK
ncbi:MAG TPA: hypothetical protein VGE74_32685 [Gemmata sp.]